MKIIRQAKLKKRTIVVVFSLLNILLSRVMIFCWVCSGGDPTARFPQGLGADRSAGHSHIPMAPACPRRWRALRLLRYSLPLPCSNQMG